jgi:hypothetical protein
MIEVHSQPVIGPDRRGEWQLTFWTGDAFDYTTPFRKALEDMTKVLSEQRCSIQLPEYEAYEDFVEGTLQFGDQALRIYYEHSLSYLSLSTRNLEILRDVAELLQASVKVIGRGGNASRSSTRRRRGNRGRVAAAASRPVARFHSEIGWK